MILTEEVGKELGRPFRSEEILAFQAGIDAVGRRPTVAYLDHHNRDLQATAEAHNKYLSFLSHDLRGR